MRTSIRPSPVSINLRAAHRCRMLHTSSRAGYTPKSPIPASFSSASPTPVDGLPAQRGGVASGNHQSGRLLPPADRFKRAEMVVFALLLLVLVAGVAARFYTALDGASAL